jgi:hypothetical protein
VRLPVARLEAAKGRSRALAGLFARYADCLLAQIIQSAACNATHSIEQRAAKWIIATAERTDRDQVPLTHEQLGMLLGVGRSYVSRVIQSSRLRAWWKLDAKHSLSRMPRACRPKPAFATSYRNGILMRSWMGCMPQKINVSAGRAGR